MCACVTDTNQHAGVTFQKYRAILESHSPRPRRFLRNNKADDIRLGEDCGNTGINGWSEL